MRRVVRTKLGLVAFAALVSASACRDVARPAPGPAAAASGGALETPPASVATALPTAPVTKPVAPVAVEAPVGKPGPAPSAKAAELLASLRDRFDGIALGEQPVTETEPSATLPRGVAHLRTVAGGLRSTFAGGGARLTLTSPLRADGATRLADAASGVSVDVTLEGAKKVAAESADGYLVYARAHRSGATWLHRASPDELEDFLHFEQRPSAPSVGYRLKLGAGAKGLRLVANTLELVDAGGAPRVRVTAPYIVGVDGRVADAVLSVDDCAVDRSPAGPWGRPATAPGAQVCTLRVSWNDKAIAYPAVLDPRWTTTGTMQQGRQGHTATLLANGKVLVVGGTSSTTLGGATGTLTSAELFDRTTNTWSPTAALATARQQHTATLLGATGNANTANKVLVAGGWNGTASVATFQLYDQTAGTWSAAANMNAGRHLHTATTISATSILIAGGMNGTGVLNTGALYNPSGNGTGTWTATGNMTSATRNHTATLLTVPGNASLNGKVLIVGGNSGTTVSLANVQLFSGTTFTAGTVLAQAREGHTATALANGNVLITGGKSVTTFLNTTFLFNAATGNGTWASAGNFAGGVRQLHTATLLTSSILSSGSVVVAGGSSGSASLATTEIWNGTTTWTAGTPLPSTLQSPSATLLANNMVLLAGGVSGTTIVNVGQVYDPSFALTCTTGTQCATGFCANGVCCDTACNGGCGACNLTGKVGTCSAVASGTTCRSSVGTCDVAETCNGTVLTCPTDAFQANTVTCRASAGTCDVAEKCTGTSAACPTDAFQANTVTCRASAGTCDLAETCSGTSAACPTDAFQPSTFTCRASAGVCDKAETCSGSSAACPADTFQPTTVTCRASAGACDVAESCNGTSAACPADAFQPSTVTCRAAAGVCDKAETCTGANAACPADTFLPVTTTCRPSNGVCDAAETCTGAAAACPADSFQPPTTTCRAATGVCDKAETCTGAAAACPADALQPSTFTCRGSAGVCDVAETCTGSSVTCPPDGFQPTTSTCRAAAGECDLPEQCSGNAAACPADAKKPVNTACTDEGNVCTKDLCDGTNVLCQHTPGNPGTVCRASAGTCDVAEVCTGSSATCPADGFQSPSTVCRASAGACDVAESCTGSSAVCPADAFQPTTTTCRVAAGECDLAEQCPGNAATCPADAKKPVNTTCTDDGNACSKDVCDGTNVVCQHPPGNPGAVCRASVGLCDVAETCTGTATSCPPDGFQPPGTVCRPGAGPCDTTETCTGTGPLCPQDGFQPVSTTCRPSAGECDPPEFCAGNAAACPTDLKKSASTPCTDDGNVCTTDLCDGTAPICQHAAGNAGTVCRASAGLCDVAETCTGSSTTCPADGFQPATNVCRPSAGQCDVAENCSGTSASCPTDGFQPPTTTCRAAGGECDVAEQCPGNAATCPADAKKPTNTTCTDDGNVCTTDLCDGTNVLCQHAAGNAGAVCRASAGQCDVAETCSGTSTSCPADGFLPSTTVCRTSAGSCDVPESCTGTGAACPNDAFLPSTTVCRTSAGQCDVAESCTGTGAACPNDAFLPSTTVCRTSAGVCDAAESCTGSNAACPMDAFLPPTTVCRAAAGTCDVAESCTGTAAACPTDATQPNGTTCNDGDSCSTGDACSAGACVPASYDENCTGSGGYLHPQLFEPKAGYINSDAFNINATGTMVGYSSGTYGASYPSGQAAEPFIAARGGSPTTLANPWPNGGEAYGLSINDEGYVGGIGGPDNFVYNTTYQHPVLYHPDLTFELPALPAIPEIYGLTNTYGPNSGLPDLVGMAEHYVAGAIGAWHLDGDTTDLIGLTTLPVLPAASFVPGRYGQGLSFNGSTCVHAPETPETSIGSTAGLTMMAWVKPDPAICTGAAKVVFQRGWDYSLGVTCNAAGHAALTHYLYANESGFSAPVGDFPLNQWSHIAVSWDHRQLRSYVNGAVVGIHSLVSGTTFGAGSEVAIGCAAPDPMRNFTGVIDEVGLFRHPMGADQVSVYMNNRGDYRPAPPIAIGAEWQWSRYIDGFFDLVALPASSPPDTPFAGYVNSFGRGVQGTLFGTAGLTDGSTAGVIADADGKMVNANKRVPGSGWNIQAMSAVNAAGIAIGNGYHGGVHAVFKLDLATNQIVDLGAYPRPPYNNPLYFPHVAAINAAGHIVGTVYNNTDTVTLRPFIYTGNGLVDLNDYIDPALGVTLVNAAAINDNDEIVGFAYKTGVDGRRAYRLKLPAAQQIGCIGKANATPCDDGNACTQTDACQAGACVGTPVAVTDNNACTTDACDPVTGVTHTPLADGAACNDSNACTSGDACHLGACYGAAPMACPQPGPCQVPGAACGTDGCPTFAAAPNGTACNDGNACTQTDACQAGTCVGANPVTCPVADECHGASMCDTQTGTCSTPATTGTSSACLGGTYDYDKAGRLIRDHATTLTYDAYDQLRAVVPGTVTAGHLPFTNLPVTNLGYIGGGSYSNADAIDMNGQISMYGTDASGVYHSLYIPGEGAPIDLNALAGTTGNVFSNHLAPDGAVSGSFIASDGKSHAFLYSPTMGFHDEGVFGDTTYAYAINSHHDFVGPYYIGNDEYGYVFRDGGGFRDIGTLGRHTIAWTVGEDGTVGASSQPPGFLNDNWLDFAHFGHAVIWDEVLGMQDLNIIADPATMNGWTLVEVSKIVGDYIFGAGLLDGDIRPFRYRRSTREVVAIGSPLAGDCFLDDATADGDMLGTAYEVKGSRSTATQHGWIYIEGQGFTVLDDAIAPDSGWKITQANGMNDAGDVVGFGVNAGKYTAYRIKLPLRAAGATGPTLAEGHTYGYDGLRTSTSTGPDLLHLGNSQYWFTQDYTETTAGNREHYVRIGNRIVAKLTMTPVAGTSGASPAMAWERRKSGGRSGGRGGDKRQLALAALLAALGLLGLVIARQAKRRGWAPATASIVALVLTAASCEMLGVGDKVKAALWTPGTPGNDTGIHYLHHGIAPGPTLITNDTGGVWEERRYEPFGQPVDAKKGMGLVGAMDLVHEPQNILGKMTNPNTGWSYHGARWAAPQTARWLSPDPATKKPNPNMLSGALLNPYQYALSSPVLFWDPDGRFANESTVAKGSGTYLWTTILDPDLATHERITSTALRNDFSPRALKAIIDADVDIDRDPHQGIDWDSQSEHATRGGCEDPSDAIRFTNNKIESRFQRSVNDILSGNVSGARREFGSLLHNRQDSFAPAHRDSHGNPKPWLGEPSGDINKKNPIADGFVEHIRSDMEQNIYDEPAKRAIIDTKKAEYELDARVWEEGKARGMSEADIMELENQFYGEDHFSSK